MPIDDEDCYKSDSVLQTAMQTGEAVAPVHRILLVDDHAALRDCLRSLVEEHPDMTVVGEACDGEEAVALVCQLRPDVVLMDVQLPRLGGIEATRRIRRAAAAPAIIGLTIHWTSALEEEMLAAGAAGCLSKTEALDRLHQTILSSRSPTPACGQRVTR